MKRLHMMGLSLVAIFALSALGASASFAAPEWYKEEGKVEIKLAAKLAVKSKGRLTLISSLGAEVKCPSAAEPEGLDEGSVGPGASDEVTKITDSKGNAVVKCDVLKEGGGLFKCPAPATAQAINLPWTTKLEVIAGQTRDTATAGVGGEPGYNVVCGNGLKNACTGKLSPLVENLAPNVNSNFDAGSGKTKCTIGEGEVRGSDLTENPGGAIERILVK